MSEPKRPNSPPSPPPSSVEELEELEELELLEPDDEASGPSHSTAPSENAPARSVSSSHVPREGTTSWDDIVRRVTDQPDASTSSLSENDSGTIPSLPSHVAPPKQATVSPTDRDRFPRPFGPYTLLQKLASGGMAELFLALQRSVAGFEKLIVIKQILPRYRDMPEFVDMLLAEARLAAKLSHHNIVQINDVGEVDGRHYIAMEHIHGEDLRTIAMQMKRAHVRRMPLEVAVAVGLGICAGLAYAHELRDMNGQPLRIVHRDVSPHNILVSYNGDIKLVDFGIAKSIEQVDEGTRTGIIKGKVPYMAPEQAMGKPVDARTDIFSTGIVLYELTTGKRLFKKSSEYETMRAVCEMPIPPPSRLVSDYPQPLEAILMRALERDPDRRYQRAKDFLSDLEKFVRESQLAATSTTVRAWMEELFAERLAQHKNNLHDLKQLADLIAEDRRKTIAAIQEDKSFTTDRLDELNWLNTGELFEPQSSAPSDHALGPAARQAVPAASTSIAQTPVPNECPRCHQVIRPGQKHCPSCGANLEAAGSTQHRATNQTFELASSDKRIRPKRPVALVERRASTSSLQRWLIVGAIGLTLVAAALVWIGLRNEHEQQKSLRPLSSTPPATASTHPIDINGVDIGTSARVDPTELLLEVRKAVKTPGTTPRLLGISVRGATAGTVDLSKPSPSVTYRYMLEPNGTGPNAPQSLIVTLTLANHPPPTRTEPGHGKVVGAPVCIWSSMWRAMTKAGLDPHGLYDIDYGPDERGDGIWTVRSSGKDDVLMRLDGRSCFIKGH